MLDLRTPAGVLPLSGLCRTLPPTFIQPYLLPFRLLPGLKRCASYLPRLLVWLCLACLTTSSCGFFLRQRPVVGGGLLLFLYLLGCGRSTLDYDILHSFGSACSPSISFSAARMLPPATVSTSFLGSGTFVRAACHRRRRSTPISFCISRAGLLKHSHSAASSPRSPGLAYRRLPFPVSRRLVGLPGYAIHLAFPIACRPSSPPLTPLAPPDSLRYTLCTRLTCEPTAMTARYHLPLTTI